MKKLQGLHQKLLPYQKENYEFAIDTNILMHEPDLLVYLLENEPVNLCMSMMVFSELDGLKKSNSIATSKRAQTAFDVIEAFQRANKIRIVKDTENGRHTSLRVKRIT